ncbi:MAG TPA: rod shape-determining protein MreD [Candidatus Binataceae bacterium]|nr:rod shape-determining protein MreD [Candidatus Binataceae bacterium]
MLIIFAIATYLALLVQTTAPLWFPFNALIPNLIIILCVDLGMRHHGAFPALLAFAIGYATDAMSGTTLGLNAFLTTSVFLLTYEMSRRLLVTNALVGATAVFFAVMLAGFGAIVITSGRGAMVAMDLAMPHLALQALISAIVAPIIFAMMAGSKRMFGLRPRIERE